MTIETENQVIEPVKTASGRKKADRSGVIMLKQRDGNWYKRKYYKGPITRQMILDALQKNGSHRAAAAYLNISPARYKGYATLYKCDDTGESIFERYKRGNEKNAARKIQKSRSSGKYVHRASEGILVTPKKANPRWAIVKQNEKARQRALESVTQILSGELPATTVKPESLKYRLINAGILKPKCYYCGYGRLRNEDNKSPLILRHKDGNNQNFLQNNLELVCYNCAFLRKFDSPVSDKFVREIEMPFTGSKLSKVEDAVYEISEYHRSVLESLGLQKKEEKPYEKYISKM